MARATAELAGPTKPLIAGEPKVSTRAIGIGPGEASVLPSPFAVSSKSAGQGLATTKSPIAVPSRDGGQGQETTEIQAILSAASNRTQSSQSTTPISLSSKPSSASSSAAAASTASRQPSRGSSNSSNTGLIAGIAVLAILLAIALAAIGSLMFRKRRSPSRHSQYEPSYEQKTPLDPSSTVGLENMESEVKSRDNRIRELQAALLTQGRAISISDIDDRQIGDRFAVMSQNVNDWVMTYFKGQDFTSPVSPRIVGLLQRTALNYQALLQAPQTRFLVIRAVVMHTIAEAITVNQFIGNIPFVELKQGFNKYASPDKANEWRTLTVSLLQMMPDFDREIAFSVQEVTARIDAMATEIARTVGNPTSRTKSLQTIVDTAAELSVDLGKQQASYIIGSEQVGGTLEDDNMEDVSQGQTGRGRIVRAIVSPALKKVSQPGNQVTVIAKAQVVI